MAAPGREEPFGDPFQGLNDQSAGVRSGGSKLHPTTRLRLENFPKIGGGLQYTVYDLGNGRVFKRPTTFWESYWRVLGWRMPFHKTSILSAHKDVARIKSYTQRSFQNLRPLLPRVSRDLGNPVIFGDLSYEQDLAVVVADYFPNHTFRENRDLVDRYIALTFRFWEMGFGEWPFKLCLNYGVDRGGALILLDLGELFFDKRKAVGRIAKRHWDRVVIRDPAVAGYYRAGMDRAMTVANVEAHWGRAL
ncbi:MAG: hypothetical protein KGJ78_12250 [Alphaproteobacteria bacterium]|nr:hypothetical protein [Alphaproteobacteria bacterium]